MSLIEVAKKINQQGDQFLEKYGINEFHKKASDLLIEGNFANLYHFQELVENSFKSNQNQCYSQLEFSDLPLTVSHGKHCFIDIYFWRRRPTVIHNHHFAGAFMCLTGKNVDLEFSFKEERPLGRFHSLGQLELIRTKQMIAGDITEIALMDKFIHQNHHQSDLTVNLCFRTPQATDHSLSNYLYSGLRSEKDGETASRVQRFLRFIDFGDFDINKIEFNQDDTIHFLLQMYNTRSLNPKLLRLITSLHDKIQNELGINIAQLAKEHDIKMVEIENEYE